MAKVSNAPVAAVAEVNNVILDNPFTSIINSLTNKLTYLNKRLSKMDAAEEVMKNGGILEPGQEEAVKQRPEVVAQINYVKHLRTSVVKDQKEYLKAKTVNLRKKESKALESEQRLVAFIADASRYLVWFSKQKEFETFSGHTVEFNIAKETDKLKSLVDLFNHRDLGNDEELETTSKNIHSIFHQDNVAATTLLSGAEAFTLLETFKSWANEYIRLASEQATSDTENVKETDENMNADSTETEGESINSDSKSEESPVPSRAEKSEEKPVQATEKPQENGPVQDDKKDRKQNGRFAGSNNYNRRGYSNRVGRGYYKNHEGNGPRQPDANGAPRKYDNNRPRHHDANTARKPNHFQRKQE